MKTIDSKDGTKIAYEQLGSGDSVILVDGALVTHHFSSIPHLANLLSKDFSVIYFDRRGRGDSGDTLPYAIEREIEDIETLIDLVGIPANLFGISSGACLSFETALKLGGKINKLAIYEAPYNSAPLARQRHSQLRRQVDEALQNGENGQAVNLFMAYVGTPAEAVNEIRNTPFWKQFERDAPSLAYDLSIVGEDGAVPFERVASIKIPVLVMDGEKNFEQLPFMHETAIALAKALPQSQSMTLSGQDHNVDVKVLAPILNDFFMRQ